MSNTAQTPKPATRRDPELTHREAAKIAASVGVEPTAIIPGSDNVAAKVDALATFNSLTDPVAKADFFAKNAQAIYASIKV